MKRSYVRFPSTPVTPSQRLMHLAATVATWSEDPDLSSGCVAVRDRRPLLMGWSRSAHPGIMRHPAGDARTPELFMLTAPMALLSEAAQHGICLIGAWVYVYPWLPRPADALALCAAGISGIVHPNLREPAGMAVLATARHVFEELGIPCQTLELEGYLGGSGFSASDFEDPSTTELAKLI